MDASRAARSDDGPAPQVAAGEYRFGQVLCTQMIAMALKAIRDTIPEGGSGARYLLASSTVRLKRVLGSGVVESSRAMSSLVVTEWLASWGRGATRGGLWRRPELKIVTHNVTQKCRRPWPSYMVCCDKRQATSMASSQ